jgi:TonB-linked SusC/RagA family outer membrane protein
MRRASTVASWTVLSMLLFTGAALAQETGTITGMIQDLNTNAPIGGAQISITGTSLGTISGAEGRFLLQNVPAGGQTVRVTRIGFTEYSRDVTVQAGETLNLTIQMESEAIALERIVVTGVAGETQRAKVPFEVASLAEEDLGPVPQLNPVSAIQGKVAGATVVSGSGRPGSAPSILLRGATSIDATGRDQEPLYIVDGVILGSSIVDLDALDIESIEIVKGAAAASLYGSRAANGVVQITTKRGRQLPDNVIRYTVRSEYGQSELASTPDALLTERHQFELSGDQFVNEDGTTCTWLMCENPRLAGTNAWDTYQVHDWPGTTYNQVERFFETGTFLQNYLGAEGRSGATNFHISMSNLQEGGVMPGQEGFDRTNFRINVDQAITEGLELSGSAFYSRSTQDQFPESQGNPMFDLTRMPAGVDLLGEDPFEEGELILNADPANNESPNPIYEMLTREYQQDRGRFLGSGNLSWSLTDFLRVNGNFSYDRLDYTTEDLYPKGFRTIDPSASFNDGNLDVAKVSNEALNASITSSLAFNLTEDIANRTQVRYLYESQDYNYAWSGGNTFAVADVPVLENLDQETVTANSTLQTVRADGYFALTNFEFLERYIIDALARNDGSSLFGEDERRQWYYRVAGAWRIAQEPWFAIDAVDELKLRYSYGTAGGRPSYYAQYETYSVSGGRISPVNLGNTDLKPEFSVEQEVGLDASFLQGRVIAGVTYAHSETEDQILPVPLPAYTGYSTQWQNAGTLTNNTYELSLQANLIRTNDVYWSARVIYDQTKSEISKLNVPPFTYGVGGQGLGSVFYAREGEELGTFYGVHYATSCADLPDGMSCDGFTVDQNGWLVYTGGADFANPAWGTTSEDDGVLVRGASVPWGTPFAGECTDKATGERTLFCPVGNSIPDYNMSFSTTFQWKGLSLYGLLDSSQGFDVYNQPLQWATFKRYSGIMDQTGVSDIDRKPVGYFDALYGVSGLQPSNVFVEDASFWKLRELSASYRFDAANLSSVPGLNRFSSIALNLTGRNLITWTDYRGFDPEVGKGGGDTGSAAIARVEGYQYPNFRTWTVGLELVF